MPEDFASLVDQDDDPTGSSTGREPAGRAPRGNAHREPPASSPSSVTNRAAGSEWATPSWFSPSTVAASGLSFGTGSAGTAAAALTGNAGAIAANGVPQVRDVFFGTSEEAACQPGPKQFVLAGLDDLYVCVVWSGLAGAYAEELAFVTPDSHLYQNVPVAFVTAGVSPPAGGMVVRGRQLAVRPAGWGANGETLVVSRLPVGGTFISQYGMAGLWTVKISLDGQPIAQDSFDLVAQ